MSKFKVEFEVESEESKEYIKTLLTGILDVTEHTDSAAVSKLKIIDIKSERPVYLGLCMISDNYTTTITLSSYREGTSEKDVKSNTRYDIDPNGCKANDLKLLVAYQNTIVQNAIINHFEEQTIRKVINDATDRAREAAIGKDKAGEA